MDHVRAVVLAALAVLCSGVQAQEMCTEYRRAAYGGVTAGPWASSPEEAGIAGTPPDVTIFCHQGTEAHYEFSYVGVSGGNVTYERLWVSDGCLDVTGQPAQPPATNPTTEVRALQSQTVECPPGCEALTGTTENASWAYSEADASLAGVCFESDGNLCKGTARDDLVVCLGDRCYSKVEFTGESCPVAPDPSSATESAPGVQGVCKQTASGQVCFDYARSQENCGTINGEAVCLAKVPPGNCVLTPNGAAICESTAGTPPGPDDGTPGSPAAPDTVIEAKNENGVTTYNIYNSGTVGGSSSGVEGAVPDGGVGEGEGEGEGSASGGEDCGAPPVCEGDPILCAVLAQQWQQRCPDGLSSEDIAGAVGDVVGELDVPALEEVDLDDGLDSTLFGGGGPVQACPEPFSFTYAGETVEIPWTAFCSFAEVLRPVILLISALASLAIIMGRL